MGWLFIVQKMKILPAIDLKDGQCVRLNRGDYGKVKKYSNDPIMVAERWVNQGAKNLHIIDLDGAKSGLPVNHRFVSSIKKKFPNLYIQVGGGVRSEDNIKMYIDLGVDKIIIGTKAIEESSFLPSLDHEFQKKIIVDIAIKNNMLAIEGWNKLSTFDAKTFISSLEKNNISEVVFTDINRDGMLSGINFDAIENIVKSCKTLVIASGGITSMDDIKKLSSLSEFGLSGIIIGKALYENKINLSEAINLFGG